MRLPILCIVLFAWIGSAHATAPDLILRGSLTGADHQTYRTAPFAVPAGVERITIEFDYTGKEQRSVIDLGLLGPDGALRGWSGGNKRIFTVSGVDATPSYLPTPTRAGKWALLMGVPNMRKDARADYTAKVYFSKTLAVADEPAILRQPLRAAAGWYRGDLHSHTGHSDGSCATRGGGQPVPCPLFLTAQAAAKRGLDFMAITEHNGIAHANTIRELQPYFDNLLLMTGRELTSFFGHANFFGTMAPVDFRVGRGQKDWNALLARLPDHGLVSINHPVRPSGELCMGCGWDTDTDMRRVQAVEAVNGADADTHAGGAIGSPTTVVYAAELSQTAILDAIRAGHVFVDVAGSPDRLLELTAQAGAASAMMGDTLHVPAGATAAFKVHTVHANGAEVQV